MTVAIIVGFLLIAADQRPMGKGLILGTIFSVINFVLMGETIPMRMGRTRGKAFFVSLGSIFFRYFLIAIPLFMAIRMEQLNLFAVIAGIFSVQLMIFPDHIFNFVSERKNKA
ncbi:MAG: hypothetical protein B6245_05975 [Desulfobacteraceae bacterium 4572_88]|nr:MAG: hypothetical protein B6245_05975 [Desulfobacteraceae bacterium 4572_88]